MRVIAATNANLEEKIQADQFREDLYYRLNVIPIFLPSLKERPEDIGPLLEYFTKKFSHKNNKRIDGISPEALSICHEYHWPGNVRELENAIENAVVLADGNILMPEDLPFYLNVKKQKTDSPIMLTESGSDYRNQMESAERMILVNALNETNGNKTHAASLLGFSIRTMRNKTKKYGL